MVVEMKMVVLIKMLVLIDLGLKLVLFDSSVWVLNYDFFDLYNFL